jgi:hypothetical protein
MSIEEYLASLETNAMILGTVALHMKNFASQIIQHSMAVVRWMMQGLLHLRQDVCAV